MEDHIFHPLTAENIDHWERDQLNHLDTMAANVRNQANDLRHHTEGMQYLLNQLEMATAAASFNHNKGVTQ